MVNYSVIGLKPENTKAAGRSYFFCRFAMLCGYELKTNIEASAQENNQSVKYVREYPKNQTGTKILKVPPNQMPDYNFNVILKHTDTGG